MNKRVFLVLFITTLFISACGSSVSKQEQVEKALIKPIVFYCTTQDLTASSADIEIAQMKETGENENEYAVSGKFYAKDKYGDLCDFKYECKVTLKEGWEKGADNIEIPFDEFYIIH